jgi:hypothetical protein
MVAYCWPDLIIEHPTVKPPYNDTPENTKMYRCKEVYRYGGANQALAWPNLVQRSDFITIL